MAARAERPIPDKLMYDSCSVFDYSRPTAAREIGKLELDASGAFVFKYESNYLESPDSFAIDPLHIPLQTSKLRFPRRGDGSIGVFSDATPDAWGRRVAEEVLRPHPANLISWLTSTSVNGAGCLLFSKNYPEITPIPSVRELTPQRIRKIEVYAARQFAFDEELQHILWPGLGLGGARPKTVVMHDGSEHIAKFARTDDLFDVPAVEYATLRLATRAGINVPSFELVTLGERTVLLVERFDRIGGKRIHYASAQSLLNPAPLSADRREYAGSLSYAGIAEILRIIGEDPERDAHEMFRRMVLNIMVGNVDDHLRNHAFLMNENGHYALSPAFDIVPHVDAAERPQSIGVGRWGAASTVENALSQCHRFLLSKSRAHEIVAEVKAIASTWCDEFRVAGVNNRDIQRLSGGFEIADEADRTMVALGNVTIAKRLAALGGTMPDMPEVARRRPETDQ